MREYERVLPVVLHEEPQRLKRITTEPFRFTIILLDANSDHLEVWVTYVLLRSHLGEAELFAVIGLKVHGN